METQRYLYETHMHTSEASACAGSTGAQMARALVGWIDMGDAGVEIVYVL